MNCDLASRYLDALVDEELQPSVERELEEHLRGCLACRCQAWEIREFRSFFRLHAPSFEAPPQLKARVRQISRRPRANLSFGLVRQAGIGAAAALAVGIFACLLALSPDTGKELCRQAIVDYSRVS